MHYGNLVFNDMVNMRRQLHKTPELAFSEFKTAEYICKRLSEIGIEYTKGVAKTGIVATIKGREGDKTLLLRADMDALPVTEIKECEYKSQNEGVMHACGHDFHMAALLGAAKVLNDLRDNFCGNIKLVFQPAEEGDGGAEPMIAEGVLKNPDVTAAMAMHMWPELEVGKIELRAGGMSASPDEFDLKIKGKSGHAAKPYECINPLVLAGKVCDEITGFTDIEKEILVTVTLLSGGNCYNVIPKEAFLGGTIRTTSPKDREEIEERVNKAINDIVTPCGGTYEFNFRKMYPPTVNDDKLTLDFIKSAQKAIGTENVLNVKEMSMIGEDFAYFAECVPSVFVRLGAKPENCDKVYPLHSPLVNFDEKSLEIACECFVSFALEYLKGEK